MAEKLRADVSDMSDETSIDIAEKGGDAPRRRGMRVNFKVIIRSKVAQSAQPCSVHLRCNHSDRTASHLQSTAAL